MILAILSCYLFLPMQEWYESCINLWKTYKAVTGFKNSDNPLFIYSHLTFNQTKYSDFCCNKQRLKWGFSRIWDWTLDLIFMKSKISELRSQVLILTYTTKTKCFVVVTTFCELRLIRSNPRIWEFFIYGLIISLPKMWGKLFLWRNISFFAFSGLRLESSISGNIWSFLRVGFFNFWARKVTSWSLRSF